MPYPGTNRYRNGFIVDFPDFERKMLNSIEVQARLEEVGLEFIEIGKGIYEVQSHHDQLDLSPEYNESWGIRRVYHFLIKSIEVYNSDVTAEWVEYGAHAGGKTRILKYRVMGRTADFLESRTRDTHL